jgi:hypothetical protein
MNFTLNWFATKEYPTNWNIIIDFNPAYMRISTSSCSSGTIPSLPTCSLNDPGSHIVTIQGITDVWKKGESSTVDLIGFLNTYDSAPASVTITITNPVGATL